MRSTDWRSARRVPNRDSQTATPLLRIADRGRCAFRRQAALVGARRGWLHLESLDPSLGSTGSESGSAGFSRTQRSLHPVRDLRHRSLRCGARELRRTSSLGRSIAVHSRASSLTHSPFRQQRPWDPRAGAVGEPRNWIKGCEDARGVREAVGKKGDDRSKPTFSRRAAGSRRQGSSVRGSRDRTFPV